MVLPHDTQCLGDFIKDVNTAVLELLGLRDEIVPLILLKASWHSGSLH